MKIVKKLLITIGSLSACTSSLAHGDHAVAASFFNGFLHPLTGIDHLLAAFAIGLIAANLARSRPSSRVSLFPFIAFLSTALLGSAFGTQDGALTLKMEWLVVASLLVFGVSLTLNHGSVVGRQMLIAILAACSLFGFAHGYVHTAGLASSAGLIEYELGWLIATALIHATGFAVSTLLLRNYLFIQRSAGALIALTGVALSATLMGITVI